MFRYGNNSLPKFVHKNSRWDIDEFCYCPTAEQIIGFLERQGFALDITLDNNGYEYEVWYDGKFRHNFKFVCESDFYHETRPEATLAAIDAALEYLVNNKK